MMTRLLPCFTVAVATATATTTRVTMDDEPAFFAASSRALSEKPILHMAGAAGRCGDRTLGAAAATCGFFKNEWVLRSPVHALCRDPAEFDYARPRARMQL